MCDCIQKTKEEVVKHMKERLPDRVIDGSFGTEISGQAFRLDGSSNTTPALTINAEYRLAKENGEPMKSVRKMSVPVFGNYCPFCGKKYE